MSPALTPVLALEYLRELSADIRAGIILDARGGIVAGEPGLAAAARQLLAGMAGAVEAHGRSGTGVVVAGRSDAFAIVLVCGSQALVGLVRHDVRLVLGDLGAPARPVGSPHVVPEALVAQLLAAVRRGPGD